jgi:hypothetical protein
MRVKRQAKDKLIEEERALLQANETPQERIDREDRERKYAEELAAREKRALREAEERRYWSKRGKH